MKNKTYLILVSAAAFATLSFSAKGQVILEVDSQTLFDTAVTSQVVDNFDDLGITAGNLNGYTTYTDTAGSFYDDFSDPANSPSYNGEYISVSKDGGPIGDGDGSAWLIGNGGYASTFTADADTYSAVGANFFGAGGAQTATVIVDAVSTTDPSDTISKTFTLTLPGATGSPSDYFAGFLAPEGYDITTVEFPSNGPGIDNWTVGTTLYPITVPTVPEPASIGLVIIGSLFLLGWIRLRVRSSKQ